MLDRYLLYLSRALLGALVFWTFTAQAQVDTRFRVELLVFSTPSGSTAEQWDATPELAYPQNAQYLQAEVPVTTPAPVETPPSVDAVAPTASTTPAAAPVSTTVYALLPASQRELDAQAAALQRSGRYHVLFHEAWSQPISSQAATASIIMDKSAGGGPWPDLQGTVKVYQADAMYIDTNLWLNTSGDYLPGTWRMPAPPRAPAAEAIESTPPAGPLSSPALATDVLPAPGSGTPAEAAPVDYPYRHAVLLKQSRKLRLGQLNYIDHPLLGVLLKVTPLTPTTDVVPAPRST